MRKHHVMVGHLSGTILALVFLGSAMLHARHLLPALFAIWARLLPGVHDTGMVSVVLGAVEAYGLGWYFAFLWRELRTERGWAFRERRPPNADHLR